MQQVDYIGCIPESSKQPMTTKPTQSEIDQDILSTIRELFEASGAQSFDEILHEVRTQSVNRQESSKKVERHLVYLIALGSVKKQDDEFGIVYGLPSDF